MQVEFQEKKRMKLKKYISVAISTIIFFIASLVVSNIFYEPTLDSEKDMIFIILGFVMFIFFSSTAIGIFTYSVKTFIKLFKEIKTERGLWKVLTMIFRIAMVLFSALIFVLWLVWTIFWIKHALLGDTEQFKASNFAFARHCAITSRFYLSGYHGNVNMVQTTYGLNTHIFGIFLTSFVFILVWSAAGFAFEIIKKLLGGNRPKRVKKEKENEKAE